MANGSRVISASLAIAGVGICAVLAGTEQRQGTRESLRTALRDLQAGQYSAAERLATRLAIDPAQPMPRAWIIAGLARQNLGQYASAVRAYRLFLASSDKAEGREFVNRQLRLCRAALDRLPPVRPPSARLSEESVQQLADAGAETFTESSEHFVVRARNAKLAKLLAEESERALVRVCRVILAGQEYPHSVEIHVWPDRSDYLTNALNAKPWSSGNFSFASRDGLAVRRIDLTQRNALKLFDTRMLDRVLPHEMCHLVVAELFGDAHCPLVLNEGLAMLAEWEVSNHRLELAGTALAGKARIPLGELLVLRSGQLRSPEVFYSEAYSFVGYLRGRMTDRQFGDFLEHMQGGCSFADAAQRALHVSDSPQFLPALAKAWEAHAVDHAQMIRTLRGKAGLTGPLPVAER
ncbi:MAG TPA: hypothetical protein VM098_10100 [Phycisphaerae bacterium]|nr:hypothetical protein [Phycisphaerae bacterium]